MSFINKALKSLPKMGSSVINIGRGIIRPAVSIFPKLRNILKKK